MAGLTACSIVTRAEWTDNFSRSNRDRAKYEVGLYEQDRLADGAIAGGLARCAE
jgi:hypothetical protein